MLEGHTGTVPTAPEIMGPRLAAVPGYDASSWLPVSGGGALSPVSAQIVADVLGRPVAPVAAEQAGLHGAYRAAAAAGRRGEPRHPCGTELMVNNVPEADYCAMEESDEPQ
ncbi:MAG: family of carbohydrate kinase, C-terminal domain [Pseudonocardiales bacterium]|nr:family of carbohydrate kinase, C-terminal domain [Pseudonocardiales bacterium]